MLCPSQHFGWLMPKPDLHQFPRGTPHARIDEPCNCADPDQREHRRQSVNVFVKILVRKKNIERNGSDDASAEGDQEPNKRGNKNPPDDFAVADNKALRLGGLRQFGDAVGGQDRDQPLAPIGRQIAPGTVNVAHDALPNAGLGPRVAQTLGTLKPPQAIMREA